MGVAITEEHLALGLVARAFFESVDARAATRDLLDAEHDRLPDFWPDMVRLGWLGLHVAEAHGGSGYGLVELAVILDEMGRVPVAGPFLSTVLCSAIIGASGSPDQQATWLPALVTGMAVGGVGLGGQLRRPKPFIIEGDAGVVLSGSLSTVLLLTVGDDLVIVDRQSPGVRVEACASIDRSRRVARVTCSGVAVDDTRILAGGKRVALRLARTLVAAEAAGGALACTEMSAEYAKARSQFGRPIGAFQAIKHRCADMFTRAEMASAAAWDAARAPGDVASAAAFSVALPGYLMCARSNIQVHGGIGFTWEHDAHLHLRRAISQLMLFGPLESAREELVRPTSGDVGGRPALDLPPEAEAIRGEVRAFRSHYESLAAERQLDALIDSGYLLPDWPRPWGRAAGPVEQLVIDEELAGIPRGHPFAWVARTLIGCATASQQQRWVRPVLEQTLTICQLFSEPGAGSDLASLSTRGERVAGGWMVTGQKVWTSAGHTAALGMALVRTKPGSTGRSGITVMMVDMKAAGVEVRPIRQITGSSDFDEVFLSSVFVPDDDVVGEIDDGWRVARATLGNERVSLGGATGYVGVAGLRALVDTLTPSPALVDEIGAILADHRVLSALDLRRASRALAGTGPGPEGNVTKLLGNELDQRVTEVAMRMLGSEGAGADGDAERWAELFLFAPCLTIGGGTSEMARNAIGERILGLPRDPLMA